MHGTIKRTSTRALDHHTRNRGNSLPRNIPKETIYKEELCLRYPESQTKDFKICKSALNPTFRFESPPLTVDVDGGNDGVLQYVNKKREMGAVASVQIMRG
jgi:hypothetical protein